jgi:flagellar biosynthesis protein FliP
MGLENMSDFSQLPAMANEATGNSFWASMVWMVFVVLLLLLIGYGFEIALLISSFACLIIAMLLAYSGLVAWANVLIFVGIILIMFIYIMYTSSKKITS